MQSNSIYINKLCRICTCFCGKIWEHFYVCPFFFYFRSLFGNKDGNELQCFFLSMHPWGVLWLPVASLFRSLRSPPFTCQSHCWPHSLCLCQPSLFWRLWNAVVVVVGCRGIGQYGDETGFRSAARANGSRRYLDVSRDRHPTLLGVVTSGI